MINVTKPFFPPIEEYEYYMRAIWERKWLTNNGPLVNELELRLSEYFGIRNVLFLANGTIALQIAIKVLELKGEIITTPFSFVATASSIVWEGATPVFADIDPKTFNIDPEEVAKKITKKTQAILATHVFGNPCDIEKLEAIAKRHGLYLLFDGAHVFGTTYKGKSVTAYGDITTLSFHATKLFHTVEGGAVIANSDEISEKIAFARNFGHDGPERFVGVGINGKSSEIHAAMGLCNLKYVDSILAKRKELSLYYDKKLEQLPVSRPLIAEHVGYNHAYYAILLPSERRLLESIKQLNAVYVYPRRYFYPSLTSLEYIQKTDCPHSLDISQRILCLPLYHSLTFEEIDMITMAIKKALAKAI
jgi:dTDP-4-amino-4,6-dideoxygalactose transaminase